MVADNQFCALGVVLIAVLARVGKIMGLPVTIPEPPEANAEVESLLVSDSDEIRRRTKKMMGSEDGEDVGKIVERSANRGELMPTDSLREESLSNKPSAEEIVDKPDLGGRGQGVQELSGSRRKNARKSFEKSYLQSRTKKKLKKGNVIDELFSDIV